MMTHSRKANATRYLTNTKELANGHVKRHLEGALQKMHEHTEYREYADVFYVNGGQIILTLSRPPQTSGLPGAINCAWKFNGDEVHDLNNLLALIRYPLGKDDVNSMRLALAISLDYLRDYGEGLEAGNGSDPTDLQSAISVIDEVRRSLETAA